ncbi:MAG: hypothetical protein NZ519_13325 [Bacteroidia bacterium]|nr:hypothetical protein [Bacteroidia bacterium]MDW8301633.1 hypothetical protein [Bacteroidia bacterium]
MLREQYEYSNDVVSYNRSLKEFCRIIPVNNLVIGWGLGFPYEHILPFDNLDYIKHFHTYPLGAFQRTKDQMKILHQYKIADLYYDMGNSDKVFLMVYSSKDESLLKVYMKEHYNIETEFSIVNHLGPRRLLKVTYK